MRAAYIEQRGPAEAIRVGDLPVPPRGPGEVLVRVMAVAVDNVDTFVRSGAYRTPMSFPFVVGRDLVGTVVESGVDGVAPGTRVWSNSMGHGGRQGVAAEFVAVPAERCYPLPAGVDPDVAVALLHPAATAYLALETHARLRAGETVFVGGGAGHVGSAAIVLAKRAGARVVASARADDLDRCRALGADVVLDYREPERLRELDSPDVYLDTSGHHDLGLATDVLAMRGRIVLMAGMGARPELPAGALYTRDASVLGFAISNATVGELADAARTVNRLLADGALAPRAIEVLPLEAAAEAHRRLETGRARGTRLVLHP